jgi:Tol biopolymer transport system component
MLKRLVFLLAGLVTLTAIGAAMGAGSGGPRLAVLKQTGNRVEIGTVDAAGNGYRRVLPVSPRPARSLDLFSIPAWSPDGTSLAFSRRTGKRRAIVIAPASGGPSRIVPGTAGGVFPVFDPTGTTLAFSRSRRRESGRSYESSSVWIVDVATGERRQLTRWRHGLEQFPSSFSPDGSTLLLMRWDIERSQDLETVALRFDGRTSRLLVDEGAFPVYSPDGSKIALSRLHGRNEQSDLYVVDADGGALRRLTQTPKRSEFFPSWDPSGERIAYSRFREFEPGRQVSMVEINADGTCPTAILSRPRVAYIGPTWQPGPGREAGRISC